MRKVRVLKGTKEYLFHQVVSDGYNLWAVIENKDGCLLKVCYSNIRFIDREDK